MTKRSTDIKRGERCRRAIGDVAVILWAYPWELNRNYFTQAYCVRVSIRGMEYKLAGIFFNLDDAMAAFERECRKTAVELAKEALDVG